MTGQPRSLRKSLRNHLAIERIDGFKGTAKAYIRFLEDRDRQFKVRIQQLQTRVQHLQAQQHLRGTPTAPIQPNVSSDLVIYIETPESQAAKKTPSTLPKCPQLVEFLNKLPKAEIDWLARRKVLRFETTPQLVEAFCRLTRISSPSHSLPLGERPADTASILEVLRDYKSFSVILEVEKLHATQLSNYGILLFFCVARVALEAGAETSKVHECLKEFLIIQQGHSSAEPEYLDRLLDGAFWVVSQINQLYSRGLRHRSWELFLLWGYSIHTYRKFAADAVTFANNVIIHEPPELELQAEVPFDIAFMIKTIIGGRCCLTVINKALGTGLSQEMFDARAATLCQLIGSLKISSLQLALERGQLPWKVANEASRSEQDHNSPSVPSESNLDEVANHSITEDIFSTLEFGEFGRTANMNDEFDSQIAPWLHPNGGSPDEIDFGSFFSHMS